MDKTKHWQRSEQLKLSHIAGGLQVFTVTGENNIIVSFFLYN